MKKLIRVLLTVAASVIALFFLLAVALYIPAIQNFVVGKLTGYVSKTTGITMRVERVRLAFPIDLAIIGPFAKQNGDTLLDARSVRVDIAMLPLLRQQVNVNGLSIYNCKINTVGLISNTQIVGYVGALNVESRGIDLKHSTVTVDEAALKDARVSVLLCDTAAKDTTSTPTLWKIKVNDLSIDNSAVKVRLPGDSMRIAARLGRLRMRDGSFDLGAGSYGVAQLTLRKCAADYDIPYAAYGRGFDVNHISVSRLNAGLDNISYHNSAVSANVNSLRLEEKSGLVLKRFTGKIHADSASLSLSGLKLETANSSLNAAVQMSFAALNPGGKGEISVKADGYVSSRDIEMAVPGVLPAVKGLSGVHLKTDVGGAAGRLTVRRAEVYAENMLSLKASGKLYDITSAARKGSLNYSLVLHNTKFLDTFTGKGVNIPYGTSAKGSVSFAGSKYATSSTLRTGSGSAAIKGSYNTANGRYEADVRSNKYPLGKILTGSGLHDLTARFTVSGRGFDVFSPSTSLRADARVNSFGLGDYDFGNTSLRATLGKGRGSLVLDMGNGFVDAQLEVNASIGRKKLAATTRADIRRIDMRRFTGKKDTLFIAARISADARTNSSFTNYGLEASFDSITITAKNNASYPTKDIYLRFANRDDSLYASLAAGDLDVYMLANGSIDRISSTVSSLVAALEKQITNKAIDQNALRRYLPDVDLYVNAGTDNPISNMLRYSAGYKFDRLRFRLAADSVNGINGNGHIYSLSMGSLLLDTIGLRVFQDSAGIRMNGIVRNVSKDNPHIFKALLKGYLDNDAARAELVYLDKDGREGMNLGVKAGFVDSGVRVHLYPETLVIAYRNFKVNKNNFITFEKNKTLLADLDLLADDGTGMKLHAGNTNDSINDISLKLNSINLKELTSTLPYMPLISGFLSSDIHVVNKNRELTATYEVNVKELGYENVPLGDVGMDGTYIPFGQDGSHGIDAFITRNGKSIAGVDGTYFTKQDSLDAKLSLLDFPVDMLNGFTGETFKLAGNLDGRLDLSGSSSAPLLNGTVKLDSVHVYSDIYNFNFNVQDDSATIRNSNLQFDELRFYSTGNNALIVSGGVDFSNLDRIPIDIRVNASDFELINASQTRKSQVYGKVFSSINAVVQGTVDNLHVRGNLNILPKTNVSYVLQDSPLSVENRLNELVTFTDFSDTTATAKDKFEAGGVEMILSINISDAARLHCDISSDKQSYVDIEGGGNLNFRYTQQGEIILTGRYTANSGEMKYALPIIPLRTFKLTNGSYIEFTGNPMNPTLNIQAKERIKASVTENDVSRSVAFDAGISITQPLSRMGLQFTLEAPEDQTVQNQLAAMSAEQRNKLAISMLATGMYLEESNTSSGFKANNALNAFLQSEVQQIAGNALRTIDLNVNVEDATSKSGETSTDYSFRFAKRFWGDRVNVIIGGRVSTGEDARNDASSFIDNVSLEYRLDNSASRYIRLYYDHNKHDPLEGQLTEMGAGIVLRRKTNTFGEIFLWKRNKKNDDAEQKPVSNTANGTKEALPAAAEKRGQQR